MLKICIKCGEEKELDKFVKSQGEYRNKCKECKNRARRTAKPVGNKGIFRSKAKNGRFYHQFRKEILERDGNKCTRCESKETLHVHHIVPWRESEELRYDPANVVTLCDVCHAVVEPKFPKNPTAWNKGKKGIYSQETLALWSEQRKGKEAWNKGLQGYRAGRKSPHNEETKMKISESKKGKPWTESRRLAQKHKKGNL